MNNVNKIPNSPFKSISFALSLIIPIGIGIGLAITIAVNGEYQSCWTEKCISFFYETFKIPLATAGLAIPISAISLTLFRSKQTHIQIQETREQTLFSNYSNHRREFVENYEKKYTEFVNARSMAYYAYEQIFPEAIKNRFSYTPRLDKLINDLELMANEVLEKSQQKLNEPEWRQTKIRFQMMTYIAFQITLQNYGGDDINQPTDSAMLSVAKTIENIALDLTEICNFHETIISRTSISKISGLFKIIQSCIQERNAREAESDEGEGAPS